MQGLEYNVDIAMCIDCTGSMGSILDRVKAKALKFYEDVQEKLSEKGKSISSMRVRVIAYRDYAYDGSEAMITTDFLELPAQQREFSDFISTLRPSGGGDEPESGLEALNIAMNSDWVTEGSKRRHIIVVWTDASAHRLADGVGKSKSEYYPQDIAGTFDELTDLWEQEQEGPMPYSSARRLLIFAPDAFPWTQIANNWELTIQYPSAGGKGLEDMDYDVILANIANSI